MNWDIYKAKSYMLKVASDLIEDGLFAAEGGRLIHEAKFAGGVDTKDKFISVLRDTLEWDNETINEAIDELNNENF